MRATLVTDERTNFCVGRLPPMPENYSKLLEEVAEELRSLAARAPDIASELRRFADDLDGSGRERSDFAQGARVSRHRNTGPARCGYFGKEDRTATRHAPES